MAAIRMDSQTQYSTSQDSDQEPDKPISPSIHTEIRSNRSIATALLQVLVKPFRPRLTTPPKNLNLNQKETTAPTGSPKLKILIDIMVDADVKELEICNVFVYQFTARLPGGLKYRPLHDLYYFAGGSFIAGPSKAHWKLCAKLASQLPEYRIHIVSVPLGPTNKAAQALPMLYKLADELCKRCDKGNRSITFAGDSSGGNIAMSLATYVTDEALRNHENRTHLKNVLLISPSLDLRRINPAIDRASRDDPLMTKAHTQWVAQQWISDEMGADHPAVSPVLADLSSLKTLGVQVHGIVGTYDVLAPDAIVFRRRLEEFGITGEWLQWEKMMHCFPLAYMYYLPESVQGKDWILNVLADHA